MKFELHPTNKRLAFRRVATFVLVRPTILTDRLACEISVSLKLCLVFGFQQGSLPSPGNATDSLLVRSDSLVAYLEPSFCRLNSECQQN